ncbi:SDR family oxidoreductase [Caballeronia sp. AZ10_KS36]|uniref:SDR family NAD(P)-dependent oxidoreductase n=1 Tax=Caballeronia sp. AZ10_KS36 TaxID=2921757 RepID=UPI002029252F|nr:SDR family oxidoreductase [Caballeronia sp. AZ10_KS36]
MSQDNKGVAVVTGASAGIGAVYAARLAKRGYDLLLAARRGDRLARLADEISSTTGRRVETVVADLPVPADTRRVESILRDDARITMLVNNAGVASVTPLISSDVDAMSRMIATNIDALTRLTYAVVPAFVQRGFGTVINISSAVAIAPEALNGVYGGSKAYVLAFSQSLKHELAGKGVRIQVVLPGATATDIWPSAGLPLDNLPKDTLMPVEAMVDAALAGLDSGEFVTIPSLPDYNDWLSFESARQTLMPQLSKSEPATRYVKVNA